jgi:hypothetical protein
VERVASRDVILAGEPHSSALLVVASAFAIGLVGVLGLARGGHALLVTIAFAASAVVALTAVSVAGHLTSGVICGPQCLGPIAAPALEDLVADSGQRGGDVMETEMRVGLALALIAGLPLYVWSTFELVRTWTRRRWLGALGGALATFCALALYTLSGLAYLA